MPRREPKVTFLVVGAQKAGTSALDHFLRQHPSIGMGRGKELHFFDDDKAFLGAQPDYRGYEQNFEDKASATAVGEITPIYLYWTPAADRIRAYNPDMRVIAILRHPVDRAFSQWNMEYGRGTESLLFDEAIAHEMEGLRRGNRDQDRVRSYLDRGLYSVQVERFRSRFPQILFIKYEEFRARQRATLDEVFRFLGVSTTCFEYQEEEVHQLAYQSAMGPDMRAMLLSFFEADVRRVERLLGWDCHDWLQ